MPATRLDMTDACLRARRSLWQMRTLLMKGLVRGGKEGGFWWIDSEDLERFIDAEEKARRANVTAPKAVRAAGR